MKLKYEDKLKIIEMHKKELSSNHIGKLFNVNVSTIKRIISIYKAHGYKAFKPKGKNKKYSAAYKFKIVKRVILGESKDSIATELKINVGTIYAWVSRYKKLGYNGLNTNQGRPKKMTKKTKNNNNANLSDKERIKELEERNAQLEMENDLLKKLRALVQQRNEQHKKKK